MPRKNLVDEKFGRLTVKEFVSKDSFGKNLWRCECECGQSRIIMQSNLKNQISCGCYKKEYLAEQKWKGYKEISGDFWSTIRRNAETRGLNFNLKIKDGWQLFIQQNRKCKLSGIELDFCRNCKLCNSGTASLDRIDNTEGYTKSNIQWIHKDINISKNNYNIDYYLRMCLAVANFHLYDTKNIFSNKIKHSSEFPSRKFHKNWKGYGDLSLQHYKSIIRGAKIRNIEFDLSIEFLWQLFLQQNKQCYLTGNDLYFNSSSRSKDGIASLDRINSNYGYIKSNVRWTHKDINIIKYTYSYHDFIEMCLNIKKTQESK